MRWSTAVLFFLYVCSVLSTEVDDSTPYLHIMARSTVYNAGERKAIYCKGRNLVEPLEWYTPSNKVVEMRSTKNPRVYVEPKNDDGMVALIIQYIKIQDSGNWTCKSGNLSESIEFIVGEKAIIPAGARNDYMEGEEGKSIKLKCDVKGYPAPVIVWYRTDTTPPTPIHDEPKKYIIRADHSLEIKNLNHADVATYICKVRQKALSHYTEKTVHLAVLHKPIMYNYVNSQATEYKTEEIYAIMNETKSINCNALANPLPEYEWYRRRSPNNDEKITDPDMVYTSEDKTYSTLKLRIQDESDIGQYMCVATNRRGQESIVFDVSLGDKPDPPDYISLYNANSSSLTFNVSCSSCPMKLNDSMSDDPKNLTIKGYSFQFVPVEADFGPDWDNAQTFDVDIESSNDTLFTVGPLANSTKYHARVCSINAAGTSVWVPITPDPATTKSAAALLSSIALLLAALLTHCY